MLELPPDITYYIEIVAFFVFALILRQIIFEPTLELLAKREQRTGGAQAEAESMRAEAAQLRERMEKALDQARQAGAEAGAQKKREAEELERRLTEEARAEAAAVLAEVRARVGREAEAARASLRSEADTIARLAAEKVLGRPVA